MPRYTFWLVVAAVAVCVLVMPHLAFAQTAYTATPIQDPGAPPVDFETMKSFVFGVFGKSMAAGMGIAGVFLGVRKLWSWLVRA